MILPSPPNKYAVNRLNYNLNLPSTPTGLPEMVQVAASNLYGSSSIGNFGSCNESPWLDKSAAASNGANLSLASLPHALKEEEGNKGSMMETLTSLYSSNQSQQSSPAAPMSATALLQKAAQMGSTRSNPSFFGNSFGVMNSSGSHVTTLSTLTHNRNELHQVFGTRKQHENLMARTSLTASEGVLEGSSLSPLTSSSNSLAQMMMQSSGKQTEPVPLKLHLGSNSVENSHTRDFLGMGGGEAGRPFLPQELAKFASMAQPWG